MSINRLAYFIISLLLLQAVTAQQSDHINWLTFEQLEDSLAVKPKKVFIDFYAEWCVYCKKMDKTAFKDPAIISALNDKYYAVKMNAESTDTIVFSNDTFVNEMVGKKRHPTHKIPLLLASRKNYPFSLPAIVILNEKFEIISRYFEYLSPVKLGKILHNR